MLNLYILLIYIILFSQYNYSHIVSVESDDIPDDYIYHLNVTSNSIKCEYCDVTICKNSYCFKADREFRRPFLEIPINANTSRLIDNNIDCETCTHSNPKIIRYILAPYVTYYSDEMYENTSTNCTKDSQCFTNKCVDNTCTFNENINITRCYHDRCGRFIKDPCENKYDCSEGDCNFFEKNKKCYIPDPPRNFEWDPLTTFCVILGVIGVVSFLGIGLSFWSCLSIYNYGQSLNKNNKKSYKEFNTN